MVEKEVARLAKRAKKVGVALGGAGGANDAAEAPEAPVVGVGAATRDQGVALDTAGSDSDPFGVGSVPDAGTSRSEGDPFGVADMRSGVRGGELEGGGQHVVELDSLACKEEGEEVPRVRARGRMHKAVLRRQAKAKKRFASLRE